MADWNCNLCKEYQSGIACTYCDDGSEFAKMSNADRIRAMNDEELAEFLVDVETHGYYDQSVSGTLEMIDWLQSEAE